jgi:hypothetical protein
MRVLVLAISVVFLMTGSALAQSKCDSGKLKEAGKKVFCKAKVYSKAAKKAEAPDAAKLTKCTDKFAAKCDKNETRGDCSVTGNCAALEIIADGCVDAVLDEVASPSGAFVELDADLLN